MRNIERLKELQNVLNSVPEDQFDLGVWIEGLDETGKKFEQLVGKCGTSACAVGWACTHPRFNEQGLSYGYIESDWDDSLTPMFNSEFGWDAVLAFFGLSWTTAAFLFDESCYYDNFYCEESAKVKVTPKDVAKRIQIIIDNPELEDEEVIELVGEMENV